MLTRTDSSVCRPNCVRISKLLYDSAVVGISIPTVIYDIVKRDCMTASDRYYTQSAVSTIIKLVRLGHFDPAIYRRAKSAGVHDSSLQKLVYGSVYDTQFCVTYVDGILP